MAFENLIGNANIKQLLNNILESNKIIHSYLFIGQNGIGKKLFAKEFAKKILCSNNRTEECNCKSCIEFENNNNPDFYILESEESIKIEQIRTLQEKIIEKPIISSKKVYIIDNSDKMTKEAQNCLLKTLEEPPSYITIILIASNENMLLNTIRSRCAKINFSNILDNELIYALENKFQIKNIDKKILKSFEGSIGKAIKLKDKIDLYNQIEDLCNNFDKKDILFILNNSEIIYKGKDDISNILDYMNVIFFEKAKENIVDNEKYIKIINKIENTKLNLNSNGNYDMNIDNMLIEIWEEFNK